MPTHGHQPNNGLLFLCCFHYVTNITQLKYDELQHSKSLNKTQNIFTTRRGMWWINIKHVPQKAQSENTIWMNFFVWVFSHDTASILWIQCDCPQCNSTASLITEIWSSTKMQATGAYWKTRCSHTYFFSTFRFLLNPLPPAFSDLTVKY